MMQSRVSGWHIWWRVVAYRCLVVLRDWLLGTTTAQESQGAENEAEAASHLVHRSGSELSL